MSPEEVVAAALAEDLAGGADVTSVATVPADLHARAGIAARQEAVIAGLEVARLAFLAVDPAVRVVAKVADGDRVQPGALLAEAEGPARALLTAERTALNLLTHLSGVATLTAAYVAAVAGTGCAVRDTRKTLPGLRALQKAAVVAGGGVNHRAGLFDALLVKDNHAAAAGGVAEATRRALAAAEGRSVQVEVDDLDELDAALGAGAGSVLLDNFALPALREAVARCRPRGVFCEASGGITLDNAGAVAATGVDAIAVGALTHSAPAADIGLDW